VVPALLRLASLAREEDAYLNAVVDALPLPEQLTVAALEAEHPAIRRRWVHRWLRAQGIHEPRFRDVEAVLSLLDPSHQPSKVNLPADRYARRTAGRLFVE